MNGRSNGLKLFNWRDRQSPTTSELVTEDIMLKRLNLVPFMGDEMDASIYRTGVAMRHTGIGRP
jgi:hypothetical protein